MPLDSTNEVNYEDLEHVLVTIQLRIIRVLEYKIHSKFGFKSSFLFFYFKRKNSQVFFSEK